VGVPTAINAIVLGPASYVMHVWYIQSHTLEANYTTRLVAHQYGGLTRRGCRKNLLACPAHWFGSADN
jgi:hypothetical protein